MKIYACLIGNWVCLDDDEQCTIGEDRQSPDLWYANNSELWAPNKREPNTYSQLDYVHIYYKGSDYRINPIFIQVVE